MKYVLGEYKFCVLDSKAGKNSPRNETFPFKSVAKIWGFEVLSLKLNSKAMKNFVR